MTKRQALKSIRDFFNREPPFEVAAHLVGHAASQIPDVFLDWLKGASREDRQLLADVLLDVVLGGDEVIRDIDSATGLLVSITLRYPDSLSRQGANRLENYMRQPGNIGHWLTDEDSEQDDRKDYRTRWRFALSLWNILYATKSPLADELFREFFEKAKDQHFSRSIELAKGVNEVVSEVRGGRDEALTKDEAMQALKRFFYRKPPPK